MESPLTISLTSLPIKLCSSSNGSVRIFSRFCFPKHWLLAGQRQSNRWNLNVRPEDKHLEAAGEQPQKGSSHLVSEAEQEIKEIGNQIKRKMGPNVFRGYFVLQL